MSILISGDSYGELGQKQAQEMEESRAHIQILRTEETNSPLLCGLMKSTHCFNSIPSRLMIKLIMLESSDPLQETFSIFHGKTLLDLVNMQPG